jgi:hypothetical protein
MTATVGKNSLMTPVPGPVPGTVMTPGYARAVAQMAYAWGWPMVNIQSRRRSQESADRADLEAG